VRGAILFPAVAELSVVLRRIDVVPVDVEELRVRDFLRVVEDLDRFAVAGQPGRDLVVGWVLLGSAGKSGSDREDARKRLERCLHAPETASREGGAVDGRAPANRLGDRPGVAGPPPPG